MSRLSDLDLLVPAFKERLLLVLHELRGQGYSPVVHETMRSMERAQKLVAEGKSKAKGGLSMHCFGLAADVICGAHGWKCKANDCPFFAELGLAAERRGLTWGGRWRTLVDEPHVQAVPVRLQNDVRAMPAEQLDGYVRRLLSGQAA